MNVRDLAFGSLADGRSVTAFEVSNSTGYSLRCMNYGATLISVKAPDTSGNVAEITLGYDRLESYLAGHPFFGSSVGRVCNRIGGASFDLDGHTYELSANDGRNLLHGGSGGFHAGLWDANPFLKDERAGVLFHRLSPDGEEGFSGNLDVTIVISLTARNEIEFEYRAETDARTPVNLTNHTYWNLAGAPDLVESSQLNDLPGGSIGPQVLEIPAEGLLEVDSESIPTGCISPVAGSPFDFLDPHKIGERIESTEYGYDHCYVLSSRPDADGLRRAARVVDPQSGRSMTIDTTKPTVQFYSSNKLSGTPSRIDTPYAARDAFCLETQYHIDAVNRPEFPSIILEPGAVYEHRTIHTFSV